MQVITLDYVQNDEKNMPVLQVNIIYSPGLSTLKFRAFFMPVDGGGVDVD